ncbi:MAG: cytochrome c5 [Bradymonadia bacterium]
MTLRAVLSGTVIAMLGFTGCGESPGGASPSGASANGASANGASAKATAAKASPVTIAPVAGSPMARAIKLYDRRCRMCHGTRGQGNGPAAGTLQPRPRSFVDAKWQASVDDAHLRRVILQGGAAVGLSAQMPPNADLAKKPAVVTALIAHLRVLGAQ